jgi:hypothetical protein
MEVLKVAGWVEIDGGRRGGQTMWLRKREKEAPGKAITHGSF